MARGKSKSYEKLYIVQKLVRVVEQNGQRFVVVKWRGFSEAHSTKEKLQNFKEIQNFRNQLEILEQEFEQRKQAQIIKIRPKTKEYFKEYCKKIFPSPVKQKPKASAPLKQRKEHSIEELVRCKSIAKARFLRNLRAGLQDLSQEDYVYFANLQNECQDRLQQLIISNSIPITDPILQEIKGVYRDQDSFRYCVCLDSKIYTCSLEEMKELFPQNLTRYLEDLLRYMEIYMGKQIKQYLKILKKRNYFDKLATKAGHILSIKQRVVFSSNPVFFGVDQEDAMNNRRNQNQRRVKLEGVVKEYGDKQPAAKKNLQMEAQKIGIVDDFYQQMTQQMHQMGISLDNIPKINKQIKENNTPQKRKINKIFKRQQKVAKMKRKENQKSSKNRNLKNVNKNMSRGQNKSRGSSNSLNKNQKNQQKSKLSSRDIGKIKSEIADSPFRSSSRLKEKEERKNDNYYGKNAPFKPFQKQNSKNPENVASMKRIKKQ